MVNSSSRAVNVYIAEEIEIYREIYKSLFGVDNSVKILGMAGEDGFQNFKSDLEALRPDVLLLGTRNLEDRIIGALQAIREGLPGIGILLLSMSYNIDHIQLLKKMAAAGEAGMAVFLRQSIQRIDQLSGIIGSVSEGNIIVDPALSGLLFSGKKAHPFMNELTRRELEILSLMAGGYTNSAIAEALFIDIKTVQHHINNMYGKVRAETDVKKKHLRVSATRMYLENTGELVAVAHR